MKIIPLSVIIPTYNELENIIPLVTRIEKTVNPQEKIELYDKQGFLEGKIFLNWIS